MENGSNGSALVVAAKPVDSMEANVGVLMRRATDVAGVCRDIVMKTALTIQKRKYVRVEGWQSIAVAYGCVASARDVEVVAGGIRAIGEVRRMSDGAVIATAEGFVGDDESTWSGRPMYARRAMAQTRAISRVCRSAFAFVVTVIDSDLSTTPAEEMEGTQGSETPPPPARGGAALEQRMKPNPTPPRSSEPPPHTDADFRPDAPEKPAHIPTSPPTHDRNFVFGFCNKDNLKLHELSEKDLAFFKKALTDNIADPKRAQFVDNNRRMLGLVDAERAYRGLT